MPNPQSQLPSQKIPLYVAVIRMLPIKMAKTAYSKHWMKYYQSLGRTVTSKWMLLLEAKKRGFMASLKLPTKDATKRAMSKATPKLYQQKREWESEQVKVAFNKLRTWAHHHIIICREVSQNKSSWFFNLSFNSFNYHKINNQIKSNLLFLYAYSWDQSLSGRQSKAGNCPWCWRRHIKGCQLVIAKILDLDRFI